MKQYVNQACTGLVCPRCKAEPGAKCRTAGGSIRNSRPHKERKLAWEAHTARRAR